MANLNIKTVPMDAGKNVVITSLNDQRMISIDLQLSPEEKKVLQDLKIGAEGVIGNFLYCSTILLTNNS